MPSYDTPLTMIKEIGFVRYDMVFAGGESTDSIKGTSGKKPAEHIMPIDGIKRIRVSYQTNNEQIVRGMWFYDFNNKLIARFKHGDWNKNRQHVSEADIYLNKGDRIVGYRGDDSHVYKTGRGYWRDIDFFIADKNGAIRTENVY